ncbi:AaceriADR056Wp [[Ashbya] aceris (nom. inval.)]|nr:AaceriADR056Wp [[Ashbya] aceris (nom. inval.)]
MKLSTVVAGGLLAAQQALGECDFIGGNYYCSKADTIRYANVGYSGTYLDVTSMDEKTGKCKQKKVEFSGSLSPLDQELTVHFRGPLRLKQFGVYYPVGDASSEDESGHKHKHKHKHGHSHDKRDAAVQYVEVTSTVYVKGGAPAGTPAPAATSSTSEPAAPVPESSTSSWSESSPAAWSESSPAALSESSPAAWSESSSSSTSEEQGKGGLHSLLTKVFGHHGDKHSSATSTSSAPQSSSTDSSTDGSSSVSGWKRVAYYTPGSTDNCTFFNHQGGKGSGTWSSCFGNSISFASSDGLSGASKPTPLDDVTFKSNQEFMIFSGASCKDKSLGDCGYYRDKIPAYHGFGGATKMFVFEFTMPSDEGGNDYNQDMPAIWLLNSKIPRTLQYGDSSCSCWKSGCGEMDLFEVLSKGSKYMISHIHDGQGNDGYNAGGGGTQDYFERPLDRPMKAAVIFDGENSNVHIVEIDGDFESSLSASTVQKWISKEGTVAMLP